jgi:hypothetical protein
VNQLSQLSHDCGAITCGLQTQNSERAKPSAVCKAPYFVAPGRKGCRRRINSSFGFGCTKHRDFAQQLPNSTLRCQCAKSSAGWTRHAYLAVCRVQDLGRAAILGTHPLPIDVAVRAEQVFVFQLALYATRKRKSQNFFGCRGTYQQRAGTGRQVAACSTEAAAVAQGAKHLSRRRPDSDW